jgi:hypothetical protein
MPSSASLRAQFEASLADRIPSALTPAARILRHVAPTGILAIDDLLQGGLPQGAITEIVGAECSGHTSLALSFIAQTTQAAKVCAWIDVSNTLHPESAACIGVDLQRLLWVRCGGGTGKTQQASPNTFTLPEKHFVPPPVKRGLHGGGCGPHPRSESKGLSTAVCGLLQSQTMAPRCAEPQRRVQPVRERIPQSSPQSASSRRVGVPSCKPWSRIEQALRVTDLLLQASGFSAVVLDMGCIAPEHVSRIPLATWFRYRAAAERTQASILLLTRHPCAKSSAGLVLRLEPGHALQEETTVFTGVEYSAEVARERFTPAPTNVVPMKKAAQRVRQASWHSRTSWASQ